MASFPPARPRYTPWPSATSGRDRRPMPDDARRPAPAIPQLMHPVRRRVGGAKLRPAGFGCDRVSARIRRETRDRSPFTVAARTPPANADTDGRRLRAHVWSPAGRATMRHPVVLRGLNGDVPSGCALKSVRDRETRRRRRRRSNRDPATRVSSLQRTSIERRPMTRPCAGCVGSLLILEVTTEPQHDRAGRPSQSFRPVVGRQLHPSGGATETRPLSRISSAHPRDTQDPQPNSTGR